MYITKTELKNFRNYESLSLDFHRKVNLILGKNAQGKTNLLESIYVVSIGRSFRTNKDSDLIKFGSDFARVYTESIRDGENETVELIFSKESKKFAKIDGMRILKTSELLEHVYIVIFSPEDLKIVKDEPEKRRKFIDRELCQIKPVYYDSLGNYKRVLNQRNTYLKEPVVDPSVMDIWDIQMSKYGADVILQREKFVEKLNLAASSIHSGITNGKEHLEICYAPNISGEESKENLEEKIYSELRNSFDHDLKRRTTGRGPHKDDLEFFIDGINARNFGSQGQQRTAALSLKLAEISIIKEETGEEPVLLLDDVMSELDIERQEFLVKSLSDVQLFITTTEIPAILLDKFKDYLIFEVDGGKVIKK